MAEVFTSPFTTYDGILISSQKELDDWLKKTISLFQLIL